MLAFFLTAAMFNTKGFSFSDVQFVYSVEQFVQKSHRLSVPPYWKNKFNELEGPEYKKRRAAYEKIVYHCLVNPKESRWLFWGLVQANAEVRLWCNKALWEISECRFCHGTGLHNFVEGLFEWDNEPSMRCLQCDQWHKLECKILCPRCSGWKRFWSKGVYGQP